MSAEPTTISPALYEYIRSVSLREDPLLKELRETSYSLTGTQARMHTAPEQAQFMSLLVSIMQARRIIELGVFTGYSSTSMAMALPEDGQMIACDICSEYTDIAQSFWKKAQVDHKVTLHLAPALQTLTELLKTNWAGHCDLIFIDADKENYPNYYTLSYELLRPGGIILIDNVLWHGKVLDPQVQDNATNAIRTLNQTISHDPRIDLSLLPIGDGLTLARKRELL